MPVFSGARLRLTPKLPSPLRTAGVDLGPAYLITGPPSGVAGSTSENFTAELFWARTVPVMITVTPSGGGLSAPIVLTFAPGETQKTFTLTPPTSGMVTLTPTNDSGFADIPVFKYASSSLVTIDAAWLAARTAPYSINAANTIYRLATDVSTPAQAFVAAASGVTLDLNGHTVTYSTGAAPLDVPNYGFELGSTPTDIPNWDVTAATGAVRVPALVGMWGSWCLSLPNITTTQTILSDPIAIPTANVRYAASIVPRSGKYTTVVTMSVIDTVTSAVLGTGNSANPNRGFYAVATFTPTTTNPVRLKIDITPAATGDTVYLDDVLLMRASIPGIALFSTNTIRDFAVRNGSVVQAYGGYASPAIRHGGVGFTVIGVNVSAGGMDTNPIEHTFGSGARIAGCTINASTAYLSNRMILNGAIYFSRVDGAVVVENNTIRGNIQQGLTITQKIPTTASPLIVRNNDMRHEATVTEGYGIETYNCLTNAKICNNTVIPINGRGMLVDGYGNNSVVHDNYFESREIPNLEYDGAGLEATALRMRAYDNPVTDCKFYNNSFVGYTGLGGVWSCNGARISAPNSAMPNTVIYESNVFKGILTGIDPAYTGLHASHAIGLTLSQVKTGVRPTFTGNTFESNDTPLNFGDNDGADAYDSLFLSNTILKSSEGIAHAFYPVILGEWGGNVSNNRLIDGRYAGGATQSLSFRSVGVKDISYGFLLDVTVKDTFGNPAVGASVTVTNGLGSVVYSGTADARGMASGIPVPTDQYSVAAFGDDNSPVHTSLNPMTVSATLSGQSGSQSVALTSNQAVTVVIS